MLESSPAYIVITGLLWDRDASLAKVNALRHLPRTCYPVIGGKRALQDPNPEFLFKMRSRDSNAGIRDCGQLPYRTRHPWAAGSPVLHECCILLWPRITVRQLTSMQDVIIDACETIHGLV